MNFIDEALIPSAYPILPFTQDQYLSGYCLKAKHLGKKVGFPTVYQLEEVEKENIISLTGKRLLVFSSCSMAGAIEGSMVAWFCETGCVGAGPLLVTLGTRACFSSMRSSSWICAFSKYFWSGQ